MKRRTFGRGTRTLILNHNLRERGTYFRAWKIARCLADRGHRVSFITTGDGWYRPRVGRRQGIRTFETPSWSFVHGPDGGWSPLGLIWRLLWVLTHRVDLVYCFSHKPIDQFPARLARLLWGAYWIADWCDLWGGPGLFALNRDLRGPAETRRDRISDRVEILDAALERAAVRGCDLLTVISTDLARRAQKLGVPRAHIHLMVSGADLENIKPLPRDECRKQLELDSDATIIGYIANWFPDEGLLLDALEHIFAAHPEVELLVAGPPFRAPQDELRRRGIDRNTRHLGRLPFARIPVFLGASDVLLLPLRNSAFNRSRWPNKIGDHLAAGRPQVASRVGDVGPLMDKFEIGIGTGTSAAAFADGVIELIENPPRREALGKNARRVAERHFAWSRIVDRLVQAMR
ncbi:glycosyltransferase family 4 protein [bacterium]|nr:glycosyltransferase family 4 protein [bacterium]